MKRRKLLDRLIAMAMVCIVLLNSKLVVWASELENDDGLNMLKFEKVVVDIYNTAAVTSNGDLYCWGDNEKGQIGNNSTQRQERPIKVLSNVLDVVLDHQNCMALTEDGKLYSWGYNYFGQVGNGNTRNQVVPIKILDNVKSVYSGYHCNGAITNDGDLYCWGWNGYGQIGNGTKTDQLEPMKILSNVKTCILGAYAHSVAITNDGDLYCWGQNGQGQIGTGTTTSQLLPVKVMENVKSASIGFNNSASITNNGDLYCWGWNCDGQIGNGGTKNQSRPVKVLENVRSVSMGYKQSAAITDNGDLYCWGINNNYEVGNGNDEDQYEPVKVLEKVYKVIQGEGYVIALEENGDLYCWGNNEHGQIGNGKNGVVKKSCKVYQNVKQISTYRRAGHCAIITDNGQLLVWGYNRYGQVGNGTLIDQYTPYKINDIDDELTVDPFDMYLYRSSLLTDPDSKAGPTAEFYINSETPGENMLKQLQKNGFASTSDAWKAVTQTIDLAMDAGKGIDYAFEEKEIYQAILMDSFETSYKLSLVDAINNDIVKDSKELLNIVKLDLKTNFQVDVIESDLLAGWSEDMRKRSLKVMTEYFEEKKLSKFVSSADKVEKILKVPKTFEDMGNQLSTYVNIRYMNDSMKMVMKELYVQCPTDNKALRDALQDCISIIDAADKEYEDLLLTSTLKVGGKEAGKAAISWMWDKGIMNAIKLKCPRVIILIAAYKSSKYFTNVMFNTDALTEQYYKMCAVEEIDKLSRKTYDGLKLKYINTRKIDSAQNYLSSIDLAFSIMKLDCDEAIKYIDALDDAALSKVIKLLGKKTGSDSLKRQIESIKKDQEQEYESILYDWLENLKEDYPEQYPNYYYLQAKREKKWKEYTISCPVDVYVYDRDNNLVASVVDNVPSSNEIGVLVDDDEKKLYFDEEDTYHVEYVGNDAGSMSIAITEYGKDNIQLKSVRFDNLPLKKGMVYKSIEDGLYQNMSEYEIENEKGNNLQPDYDSNKETESVKNHVNVENGVLYQDSVPMKEGDIGENEKIMIQATVPVGYEFVRWKVQGDVEIKDNTDEYTSAIMGKKSTTIIAEIREMKQQPDFDEKITDPPYVKTENNTQSILANDTQGTTQNVSVPVPTVSKLKKVKIKAARKGFLLSWKKMKKVSGYQLQISSKKNFKGAKKIAIKKGATNYHTKKLKSKRKYYVRVRAYKTYTDRSGRMQKAYGKWVVVKTKTK